MALSGSCRLRGGSCDRTRAPIFRLFAALTPPRVVAGVLAFDRTGGAGRLGLRELATGAVSATRSRLLFAAFRRAMMRAIRRCLPRRRETETDAPSRLRIAGAGPALRSPQGEAGSAPGTSIPHSLAIRRALVIGLLVLLFKVVKPRLQFQLQRAGVRLRELLGVLVRQGRRVLALQLHRRKGGWHRRRHTRGDVSGSAGRRLLLLLVFSESGDEISDSLDGFSDGARWSARDGDRLADARRHGARRLRHGLMRDLLHLANKPLFGDALPLLSALVPVVAEALEHLRAGRGLSRDEGRNVFLLVTVGDELVEP